MLDLDHHHLLPPVRVALSITRALNSLSNLWLSGIPLWVCFALAARLAKGSVASRYPQQVNTAPWSSSESLLESSLLSSPSWARSMAASVSALSFSVHRTRPAGLSPAHVAVDEPRKRFPFSFGSRPSLSFASVGPRRHYLGPLFAYPRASTSPARDALLGDGFASAAEEEGDLTIPEERPVKFLLWVVFWASLSLAWFAASKDANAAVDSIKASGFGVKVASKLRSSGWPDEAVVFALATLPVIELRGAIPVGYWMQLKPSLLTVLSVIGNMLPVPFIILYLKKLATFLARRSRSASRLLEMLFERAKEKAGPVEEFQWLGLMLFVAVPFPGTGAWTGAIIASVLDMPFWPAVTANFCGVVLAGLLVNLLVNLGLKYAIVTGIILFFISTFMWSILRSLRKSLSSSN